MDDIRFTCVQGHATLVLPPPDTLETEDGTVTPFDRTNREHELDLRQDVRRFGCPRGGGDRLRCADPV